MKSTNLIQKAAFFHVTSAETATPRFRKFAEDLRRSGHELVPSDEISSVFEEKTGWATTPLGKFIGRFGKGKKSRFLGFSKFTVVVIVDRPLPFSFVHHKEGMMSYLPINLLKDLFNDESGNTAIITDPEDYDWLIKKMSNVHGVRPKDINWLNAKAAVKFGLDQSIVVSLVNKVRPRTPDLKPAH